MTDFFGLPLENIIAKIIADFSVIPFAIIIASFMAYDSAFPLAIIIAIIKQKGRAPFKYLRQVTVRNS